MTGIIVGISIYIFIGYIMLAMCEWNNHIMKTRMTTAAKWFVIFGWLPFIIRYFIINK